MRKPPPLVYIAGPYRAATSWLVEQNIRAAEAVAYQVGSAGAYPLSPHTCTRGYFESLPVGDEFWLEATLELMRRCDAVLMMETWKRSSGARGEHDEALRLGKPVFYTIADLEAWLASNTEAAQ